MVSKPLTIAGIPFASQTAAIARARLILYAGQPGSEITGVDTEFVEALLFARPDKVTELRGRKVSRYLRDWQPKEHADRQWNLCFWAALEDGPPIDFSFMTAIKMLGDAAGG
jgi:hypothetical protein